MPDTNEPKVSAEVAEAEFARFTEAMDLDVDVSKMDEDDRKGFDDARSTIERAIMRGSLVIDDKGQPIYTPQDGKPITFYEPTGASIMAMDGHKKGHDAAKMFALMADMTKTTAKTFAQLNMRDFKVCQKIVMLFLG
jgi:hypothetical protein